jgi:hypothetical protein
MEEVQPRWATAERRKHAALIGLAAIASTVIAAAPRNERRLFLMERQPAALAASIIEVPEETGERSSIFGALEGWTCRGGVAYFRGLRYAGSGGMNCGRAGERYSSNGSRGRRDRDSLRESGFIRPGNRAFGDPGVVPDLPGLDPSGFFAQPDFREQALAFGSTPISGELGDLSGFGREIPPPSPPPSPLDPRRFPPGVAGVPLALVGEVPEPASWLMMISGFALVGLGLRRKASAVAFS